MECTTHTSKPIIVIIILTGHMQWLYDLEGNRYLDMIAGIATVIAGHAHPKIQEVSHIFNV